MDYVCGRGLPRDRRACRRQGVASAQVHVLHRHLAHGGAIVKARGAAGPERDSAIFAENRLHILAGIVDYPIAFRQPISDSGPRDPKCPPRGGGRPQGGVKHRRGHVRKTLDFKDLWGGSPESRKRFRTAGFSRPLLGCMRTIVGLPKSGSQSGPNRSAATGTDESEAASGADPIGPEVEGAIPSVRARSGHRR